MKEKCGSFFKVGKRGVMINLLINLYSICLSEDVVQIDLYHYKLFPNLHLKENVIDLSLNIFLWNT